MTAKQKEKNFMVQGSILAIAGVITKIIGAVYRIPLMNIVGDEGMGYYNVAFSIYTVALTLTSYSLPLAVSKLVSARIAVGQYRNAYKVFKGAFTFALLSGGLVALIIFFGAEFYRLQYHVNGYECLRSADPGALYPGSRASWRASRIFPGKWFYGPDSGFPDPGTDRQCGCLYRRGLPFASGGTRVCKNQRK